MNRFFLGWIPFWLYSAFVFITAILPPDQVPSALTLLNDKVTHGLEYFLLSLLTWNAFARSRIPQLHARISLFTSLYGLATGAATELAQRWVPGRFSEWWDWVADGAGILLGLGVIKVAGRLKSHGGTHELF